MLKTLLIEDDNPYNLDIVSLEKAAQEKNNYEQLLSFLVQTNLINTKDYELLWSEYKEIVKNYIFEINKFSKKLKTNLPFKICDNWNFNFEKGELYVQTIQ